LLFEVEAESLGQALACPQCDCLLEEYELEEGELEVEDDFGAPEATLALGDEDSIAATISAAGLSEAVQERILSEEGFNVVERTQSIDLGATGGLEEFIAEPQQGSSESASPGLVFPSPAHPGPQTQPEVKQVPLPQFPNPNPTPLSTEALESSQRSSRGTGRPKSQATRVLDLNSDLPDEEEMAQLTQVQQREPRSLQQRVAQRSEPQVVQRSPSSLPVTSASRSTVYIQPKPKRSWRIPLLLLLFAGLVLGAVVWYLNREPPPKTVEPISEPELSWEEHLEHQIKESVITLPAASNAEPLKEIDYLVAGDEALFNSLGSVPGMPSAKIPPGMISTGKQGRWVRPLKQALSRVEEGRDRLFALGLNDNTPTDELLLIARSAYLAGRPQLALLVRRDDSSLGTLAFWLQIPGEPLPVDGAVVIRIGKLGFRVNVKDQQGKSLSKQSITLKPNQRLDLSALREHLDKLKELHAELQDAIIYPAPELPLEELAQIMTLSAQGEQGPRFPRLTLVQ